jgi:hypothetical protein
MVYYGSYVNMSMRYSFIFTVNKHFFFVYKMADFVSTYGISKAAKTHECETINILDLRRVRQNCGHITSYIKILLHVGVTYRRGFGLDVWIYCTLAS